MNAVAEVIEGTWEEISLLSNKFNGHRLRVTILPELDAQTIETRLRALDEWVNMPRPVVPPLIDDSRTAIYGEDVDRG